MKKEKLKKIRLKKGFTLIETLVAISILMIGVASSLTVAQRSLTASSFTRDQVTAMYLAQDAFEYIRNQRDKNAFAPTANWLAGIAAPGDPCHSLPCHVDAKNDQITVCSGGICDFLTKDSDGIYQYGASEETYFKRTVRVVETGGTDLMAGEEAKLTVIVEWASGPFQGSRIEAVSYLYNWIAP